MNIQEIIDDEKKKRVLTIAFVVIFLFIILIGIFVFTKNSTPTNQNDAEAQRIADFEKLKPREGFATTTLKLAPIIAITADHPIIAPGQSAKISWEVTNATSCINVDGNPLDLKGSISVSPMEPYTFDVLCTGPNGTDLQSITVAVTTLPIITLTASPGIVEKGGPSSITWSVTNADRCTDPAGKTLRLNGGIAVSPTQPYFFEINCTGPKGSSKKSVTIAIAKNNTTIVGTATSSRPMTNTISQNTTPGETFPTDNTRPSVSLSASPTNIDFGKTTTLSWQLQNITYCVFTSDGSIEGLPAFTYLSGNRATVPLSKTQTYTLTCTKNAEKVVSSIVVSVGSKPTVPDPTITGPFIINPAYTATFGAVKATWKTKDATSCTINKNGAPYKTSLPPNNTNYAIYESAPGTSTYILICSGPNGTTTSDPISVKVIDCQFKNGFGDGFEGKQSPEEIISGQVRLLDSTPVCTYTYGDASWPWNRFSKVFNLGAVSLSDAGALCNHTYYTKKYVNGNLVTSNYYDTVYHPKWKQIPPNPTTETHNVWELTGYHYGGALGTGSRHDEYGWVSRTGVHTLTCQVIN